VIVTAASNPRREVRLSSRVLKTVARRIHWEPEHLRDAALILLAIELSLRFVFNNYVHL
jgi:hypothetical protein